MKSFIFILVSLLLSCSGSNSHSRNSELVVEYYGTVESSQGGASIDEAMLKELLAQQDKTHYIIFSDDMCGACALLKQKLRERNWIDEVYFVNLDDKWVQQLAVIMNVKAVPTLVVELKDNKGALYFEGPAEIMMYLARNL